MLLLVAAVVTIACVEAVEVVNREVESFTVRLPFADDEDSLSSWTITADRRPTTTLHLSDDDLEMIVRQAKSDLLASPLGSAISDSGQN
jgi:hypothetical protein